MDDKTAWKKCYLKFPDGKQEQRLFCLCARLKIPLIKAFLINQECCKEFKKPFEHSEAYSLQKGFIESLID